MRFGWPLTIAFLLLAAPLRADERHANRQCFSDAEARAKIESENLMEPFPVMRAAANEHHAEAIKIRLCASDKGLVYDIVLLRRDGRLIHDFVDAETGKSAARER